MLEHLLEAAQAAANADSESTTADILDRVVGEIKAAFGASHTCVHFVEEAALEGSTTMHGMLSCPVGSVSAALAPRLGALEKQAMELALAAGRPMRISELRGGLLAPLADEASFEDGLIVPVAYQGETFAWINVYVGDQAGVERFDGVDTGLLRAIGGVVYGAIKKEAFVRAIQRIRATLETHFSPRVVDKLIASPESLASQHSERLDVTVLFSDIRGFTALSERLEPDVVAEMVSEHLDTMASVVFRYDGIVDKYIGDSVMAVFGSPFPQGDHPQRAVAAALAMIEAQRDLQSKWGERIAGPLAIGIGVNTGIAIVGDVGMARREFTHLGDTVNLASRLKDVAQPWQVLIGESTYERVPEAFRATRQPPFTVKGKSEPVIAYDVAAVTVPVATLPTPEAAVVVPAVAAATLTSEPAPTAATAGTTR